MHSRRRVRIGVGLFGSPFLLHIFWEFGFACRDSWFSLVRFYGFAVRYLKVLFGFLLLFFLIFFLKIF